MRLSQTTAGCPENRSTLGCSRTCLPGTPHPPSRWGQLVLHSRLPASRELNPPGDQVWQKHRLWASEKQGRILFAGVGGAGRGAGRAPVSKGRGPVGLAGKRQSGREHFRKSQMLISSS